MGRLTELDHRLFTYLNTYWHNELFDNILPIMRHANFWVPLYLFLLVFVIQNGKQNVFQWILVCAAMVTFSNYLSSDIIKENFFRIRPCNDPSLIPPARLLLSYRPQSSSFISSHAANHWTMAIFFYMTLKKFIGRKAFLFFAWAILICYAQVYVGVHYPFDVLAGAIVGIVFGYLCGYLANRYFPLA